MTTETLTITDFLLARIADEESLARDAASEGTPSRTGWQLWTSKIDATPDGERLGPRGSVEASPARVLAECKAKRRIVELHESWPVLAERPESLDDLARLRGDAIQFRMTRQIQWLTQQEYRGRFGDEPPTAPMIAEVAAVYADHPDYREEWRP